MFMQACEHSLWPNFFPYTLKVYDNVIQMNLTHNIIGFCENKDIFQPS